ncbi:invasion associated locus B family protein [Pinisolibacter sp.]|uniref:invasion associated locus B family protein n=1 Tax=Pinisolibacter sp. TaxID=2172024 RepID=UPI002FDDA489
MTVTVTKSIAKIARAPLAAAFVATAALTAVGVLPASAQSATADEWVKVCRTDEKQKKEICKTAYDLRTSGGQFLASIAVVEASGEARKFVDLIMPTGLLLQPGIKIQVDQNKAEDGKYGMCAADGCIAQLVASDALVGQMKKGTNLTVTAQGQSDNPVDFVFPLATFKASIEGKAMDDAALKKREEAIAAENAQKQKSIEDQLREQQRKAVQQP